jgi:NADPH:quinone reductase-like Zn-dependent oxidoreductase
LIGDNLLQDILGANGIVEIPEEGFGFEAAGIVTAIGPEVKDIKVGQRVMLFNRGSLSASIMVSELLCEPIPDDLSFEDAVTMPCVCATAWHALFSIGRLSKGQVNYQPDSFMLSFFFLYICEYI